MIHWTLLEILKKRLLRNEFKIPNIVWQCEAIQFKLLLDRKAERRIRGSTPGDLDCTVVSDKPGGKYLIITYLTTSL